jgi:hypothetical protein
VRRGSWRARTVAARGGASSCLASGGSPLGLPNSVIDSRRRVPQLRAGWGDGPRARRGHRVRAPRATGHGRHRRGLRARCGDTGARGLGHRRVEALTEGIGFGTCRQPLALPRPGAGEHSPRQRAPGQHGDALVEALRDQSPALPRGRPGCSGSASTQTASLGTDCALANCQAYMLTTSSCWACWPTLASWPTTTDPGSPG